jgi:hypothetical protein
MKSLLPIVLALVFLSGCSATWNGIKDDTSHAVDWSKGKVNKGADYVKEKTE